MTDIPYSQVILELFSRIQCLEEQVAILTKGEIPTRDISEDNPVCVDEDTGRNKKVTDEMMELCYQAAKKMSDGVNTQELVDDIVKKTDMNRNSATMYLYAVNAMFKGEIFKRAISAKAIEKFFDKILRERGSDGLKKAINATKKHIAYRKKYNLNTASIEKVCIQAEDKMKNSGA